MRRKASPPSSPIRSTYCSVSRQYSAAASPPSHSRALSYAIAPPRRAKPPLRPLAPEATARASCTRTRLPLRASVSAAEMPVTPPPTIATSAEPSSGRDGSVGAASASQKESATRRC